MKFLFYLFALILVFAGLRVITSRNPVHAALFLVLAFFSAAGIWLLLEAEFLAITLVLVYVGAVMVLFLFVVMMLDINLATLREGLARGGYLPIGILVGLVILAQIVMVVGPAHFGLDKIPAPAPMAADAVPNTVALGKALYTEYAYPFEIAAALLLVAMIAAIALTMREHRQTKYREPSEQVTVRKADRLRIVKMPAERNE
jgi:NADH-quinone oxidoreductase subunit J